MWHAFGGGGKNEGLAQTKSVEEIMDVRTKEECYYEDVSTPYREGNVECM